MVPVVFGTARWVVTVLLRLVPSRGSLLPPANQRGKTERVTGAAGQGPCVQTLEGIHLFIFSIPLLKASYAPGSVMGLGDTSREYDRQVPVIT